jgi:hypothetical protein
MGTVHDPAYHDLSRVARLLYQTLFTHCMCHECIAPVPLSLLQELAGRGTKRVRVIGAVLQLATMRYECQPQFVVYDPENEVLLLDWMWHLRPLPWEHPKAPRKWWWERAAEALVVRAIDGKVLPIYKLWACEAALKLGLHVRRFAELLEEHSAERGAGDKFTMVHIMRHLSNVAPNQIRYYARQLRRWLIRRHLGPCTKACPQFEWPSARARRKHTEHAVPAELYRQIYDGNETEPPEIDISRVVDRVVTRRGPYELEEQAGETAHRRRRAAKSRRRAS